MKVSEKKRICLFVHYSTNNTIPYYVQIYLSELSRHFNRVLVLTNNSSLNTNDKALPQNIEFNFTKNKGYDFGMFYRYLTAQNLNEFSQIALVNDSNILLNRLDLVFDWANKNQADFWGIIDSHEKPWFSTHDYNYHIQSHFIVFQEKAISLLPRFFKQIDMNEILNEKSIKKVRRLVIDKWEIGLTQFFLKHEISIESYLKNDQFREKYQTEKPNITHSLFHELAAEGYPFLKKKIIKGEKKFLRTKHFAWEKTVNQYTQVNCDKQKLLHSLQ